MTVTNAIAPTTSGTPASSTTGKTALSTLSGNLNDFLNLLMKQLQNQDPTSPMDTNTFTTQLVQFSSVEQQINTNTSLTSLIQATQGNTLLNSSSMVGKTVEVTSDQVSLQNGSAAIKFTTTASKPVDISIMSQSGVKLAGAVVTSAAGANSWTWNGQNSSGTTLPDGAYKIAIAGADGSTVPFTVLGTATGVERSGTTINVQLGKLGVDFSTVQSVANK